MSSLETRTRWIFNSPPSGETCTGQIGPANLITFDADATDIFHCHFQRLEEQLLAERRISRAATKLFVTSCESEFSIQAPGREKNCHRNNLNNKKKNPWFRKWHFNRYLCKIWGLTDFPINLIQVQIRLLICFERIYGIN